MQQNAAQTADRVAGADVEVLGDARVGDGEGEGLAHLRQVGTGQFLQKRQHHLAVEALGRQVVEAPVDEDLGHRIGLAVLVGMDAQHAPIGRRRLAVVRAQIRHLVRRFEDAATMILDQRRELRPADIECGERTARRNRHGIGAAAPLRLHELGIGQDLQCLAHRHRRHRIGRGQGCNRWQSFPRLDAARQDVTAQRAGDAIVEWARVVWGRRGVEHARSLTRGSVFPQANYAG